MRSSTSRPWSGWVRACTQVQEYVDVNETGTATLLQTLIRFPVERLVVASSMSIYGEGLYVDQEGQVVGQAERVAPAIRKGEWDPRDASGRSLTPVPTPETKPPALVPSKSRRECA
jgi:dTDP-L-rhamnose 4-epimerase